MKIIFLIATIIAVFFGCERQPQSPMGVMLQDFADAMQPNPKTVRMIEKYEKQTTERICKNAPLVGEESGFQLLGPAGAFEPKPTVLNCPLV